MRLIQKFIPFLLAAAAPLASMAAYPERPVRLVVPFGAGGSTDVVFRVLSVELGKQLGQPVIIENKPGAAATIGMKVVADSEPDGYTLGAATLSFAANPPFMKDRMPFNAQKDFEPVSLVGRTPLVLTVHPSVPVRTAKELVEYNRKNPGKLNYGSAGIASSGHLGGALFESLTGTEMTHVPYSTGQVVTALVGGELQVLFGAIPSSLSFVQSNRMVAIGVTSAKRVAILPNVPTLAESGVKGYEAYDWQGIVVPKGTPEPVIRRLHAAIAAALKVPAVREGIEKAGAEVVGSSPREFQAYLDAESAKWAKVAAEVQARQPK